MKCCLALAGGILLVSLFETQNANAGGLDENQNKIAVVDPRDDPRDNKLVTALETAMTITVCGGGPYPKKISDLKKYLQGLTPTEYAILEKYTEIKDAGISCGIIFTSPWTKEKYIHWYTATYGGSSVKK